MNVECYSKVVCRSLCDIVIFKERSKGSEEENLSGYLRLNHSLQRELNSSSSMGSKNSKEPNVVGVK